MYSTYISINENASSDVRTDLDEIMDHLVKENKLYYKDSLFRDYPIHSCNHPSIPKVSAKTGWQDSCHQHHSPVTEA
ncbi:MAG: YjbQ family protein [Bacteroidaceae bacterium]|nr:YjbQ family protein [Bacteroidaceae bacterium]